jgi:hypothetical protein
MQKNYVLYYIGLVFASIDRTIQDDRFGKYY